MSKHRVYLASNYSLNLFFLLSKPYKSQVSHYHRKNRFKSLNLKIFNSIQFLFLPFLHAYIYKAHVMQARQ
jgi:hypothetical protein